jgi:hypothetical protein
MCMYRMYLVCILYVFLLTYFNPYVHVLYVLYVCACMLYVWYVLAEASTECICVCIVCIVYVSFCIVCICPDKHGCQHNVPKRPPAGAAPRGPHSGHPWAGGRPLFPAIGDPPPDPFWRTGARSTRWGIQSAPPAQPIGIPHAFRARRARPEPRRR